MMNERWVLRFYPRFGQKCPSPVRSVAVRLQQIVADNCRGPYSDTAIKIRVDAIIEGLGDNSPRRSGIRTYPFANNIACADINIKRLDWQVPIDSYSMFLWTNLDRAISNCVEKLAKNDISFDGDKLRQDLTHVEAEFLGRSGTLEKLPSVQQIGLMDLDGYPEDESYPVVIQYRIQGYGTAEDFDRRVKIETLLEEFLSEADLGYLDGGDIGSGTTNIFCFLKPGGKGTEAIIQTLRNSGYLAGAVIQETVKGVSKVVWPPNYIGEFSIL